MVKILKKAIPMVLALSLVLSLLSVTAFALDNVASVNGTNYATLDEAIQAASDTDTIELLKDCELGGQAITSPVTINGNSHTVTVANLASYSDANSNARLLVNSSLTLNNCKLLFTSDNRSWNISMNAGGSFNLANGSECNLTGHGIYSVAGASINVDASSLSLKSMNYTSMMSDGITPLNLTNGAVFLVEKAMGINGLTSFDVTADASSFTVKDCNSQGMVRGSLTLSNGATALFDNDFTGYNMYATSVLTVNDGATLTMQNCGSKAILMQGGTIQVNAGGTMNVTANGAGWYNSDNENFWSGKAAIAVGMYNSSRGLIVSAANRKAAVNFADGANVNISDNYVRAISNFGTVNLGNGTVITNNGTGVNAGSSTHEAEAVSRVNYGGGIYNAGTLTMASGAQLYNNHAATAGDDIYNTTFVIDETNSYYGADATRFATLTGVMTLSDQSGFKAALSDCGDTITGWFYDGVNAGAETARWNVSGCIDGRDEFISLYTIAASDNSNVALKAAHAVVEEEEIPDEKPPLVGPDEKPVEEEIPDEKPPLAGPDEKPVVEETIEDDNTPLAGPNTGDNFSVTALVIVMVLSVLGVTVLVLTKKKKHND